MTNADVFVELFAAVAEVRDTLYKLQGVAPPRPRLTVIDGRKWRRATPRRRGHLRAVGRGVRIPRRPDTPHFVGVVVGGTRSARTPLHAMRVGEGPDTELLREVAIRTIADYIVSRRRRP